MTPLERKAVIEARLRDALNPKKLLLVDESNHHIGHPGAQQGASHFALEIACGHWQDLNTIQKHQAIYAVLSDLIPHEIHALKIKAI